MFRLHHRPDPGARDAARRARRLVPTCPEPLEERQSTSILGIGEQVSFGPPPARPGGIEQVEVSGTVTADRPISGVVDVLLYDGDSPETPIAFPAPLVAAGDGHYTYTLPLALSTGHLVPGRGGHRYALAVTAQDPTSTATSTANFTLPTARPHPVPPAASHPSGHRR